MLANRGWRVKGDPSVRRLLAAHNPRWGGIPVDRMHALRPSNAVNSPATNPTTQRPTFRVATTLVPASFPGRPSRDPHKHIGMVRYAHFDGMRASCLFVPLGVPLGAMRPVARPGSIRLS